MCFVFQELNKHPYSLCGKHHSTGEVRMLLRAITARARCKMYGHILSSASKAVGCCPAVQAPMHRHCSRAMHAAPDHKAACTGWTHKQGSLRLRVVSCECAGCHGCENAACCALRHALAHASEWVKAVSWAPSAPHTHPGATDRIPRTLVTLSRYTQRIPQHSTLRH
jgi:hypothetical protein